MCFGMMKMIHKNAAWVKRANFIVPKRLRTAVVAQTISANCFSQQTGKKTCTGLRYRDFDHPCLLIQKKNRLPIFVPQSTRALHDASINLGFPVLISWQQAHRVYQEVYGSLDREVWNWYMVRQRCMRELGIEWIEWIEKLYPIGVRSPLELNFDTITICILRGLGVVSGSGGGGRRGEKEGTDLLIPRITVRKVFSALDHVTVPDQRRLKLSLLGLPLSAIVEELGRRFGPLDALQKLVVTPLLPDLMASVDAAVETAAAYKVITAYIFYTAATPQHILEVLSQIWCLDHGEGLAAQSKAEIGLTEYFHFLRLFLELCEHDDVLREIEDKEMTGEMLDRQSRRILMWRLDGSLSRMNKLPGSRTSTSSQGTTFPNDSASGEIVWTEEQARIIGLNVGAGELLKVKAFAGTGKTQCTVEYAKARPGLRILYVVFNVNAQKEAERKFGPGVDCKTLNALTFRAVQKVCPQLFNRKIANRFGYWDVLNLLNLDEVAIRSALVNPLEHSSPGTHQLPLGKKPFPSKHSAARVVYASLLSYMVGREAKIGYESLHWITVDKLGLKKDAVLGWTEFVWREIIEGRNPLPHPAYVKMMYLQAHRDNLARGLQGRCKADAIAFGKYDIIMFDEAQDSTPVTAEIILRQRPYLGVIVVGDPYQMIYRFMGANNACFDDALYPPTHKQSLTHSFRFGENITGGANQFLGALRGTSQITAAGDADIVRRNFLDAVGRPPSSNVRVKILHPGPTDSGGSGKYVKIFRGNRSLVVSLLLDCIAHPNHKFHLRTAETFSRSNLFMLLKSGYDLYHGIPAEAGILRGFKSWEALTRSVQTKFNTGQATKIWKSLFKAAMSGDGIDAKMAKLLVEVMLEDSLRWELKDQVQRVLDRNPPPKLKEFLEAALSKGEMEKPDQLLSLVAGLEAQFSEPHFLKSIESSERRVVFPDDSDAADIVMVTGHQAKGSEWDRVELVDDFSPSYSDRYDLGTMKNLEEQYFLMYVAITRARKELVVGPKIAAWLAAKRGSFRFFWSYGECPVCRYQDAKDCGSAAEMIGRVHTHRELIGYEAMLPLGNFGAELEIPNEPGKSLFGDRKEVIGCRNCVMRIYQTAPAGRKCELEEYVNRKPTVGGNEDSVLGVRKRWREVIGQAIEADSKRVNDWERGYMTWSLGIPPEDSSATSRKMGGGSSSSF